MALAFAEPMYAVNWKLQSCQSLCSPLKLGALPMLRVSTSGAMPAVFFGSVVAARASTSAFSVSNNLLCMDSIAFIICLIWSSILL